jgi:hypothetical protein
MHSPRIILSLLLFFVTCLFSRAQVNGGSADFATLTRYTISGEADSLFVFYNTNPNRYISALTPDGDSALITWYRFDPVSTTYVPESSVTDTVAQLFPNNEADFSAPFGYMIVITGDDYTDTSRCWMVLNSLEVAIINADTSDVGGVQQKVIRELQKRCNLVSDIKAGVTDAEMLYYDLASDEIVTLNSSYTITELSWTSSPDPGGDLNTFAANDKTWLSVNVNNPWWRDSYFIISVTDTLGYTVKDSVFCESVIPHANFTFDHIPLDSATYYPDKPDRYYEIYGAGQPFQYGRISAPALYLFRDSSENANLFTWYFDDGTKETVSEDTVLHTYLLPGNYYPYLLAENFLLSGDVCADTFPDYRERTDFPELKIIIDEPPGFAPETQMPNVFSPPNPPNNYWRFYQDASVTDFEIAIYNRYGQRVHHYVGNIRDWEGWDGRIRETKRVAATGVYYYVIKEIRALPIYDNPLEPGVPDAIDIHENRGEDNNLKRGFIHLYNNE